MNDGSIKTGGAQTSGAEITGAEITGTGAALVTGATGGIGREFVRVLCSEQVEEIWAVARTAQKLEELKAEFGEKIVPIPLDLSTPEALTELARMLRERQPEIRYLVNNAGVGERLSPSVEYTPEQAAGLIAVNCTAVASICALCVPFMAKGSRIINLASQSAFQPVPYLNLYASSKAFVRSYTRALNVELRNSGITATAVCPGWVDTEMLEREVNGTRIDYPGIVRPDVVVQRALADAKRGRDMSVCSAYVKYLHVLAKLFPQRTVMKTWMRQIQKYLQVRDNQS